MIRNFTLAAIAVFFCGALGAQTIWTGITVTVTKVDGSDWTLPENQDQITGNVHITRANNQGIFNIADEANYTDFVSPTGTEWAFGTTADIESLTFNTWENTNGSNPPSTVDQDMVLHLITDDIYIDIKMTYWGSGQNGGQGGFTYERSSNDATSTVEMEKIQVNVFPNPTQDQVQFSGVETGAEITVLDQRGVLVYTGTHNPNTTVDVSNWTAGVYFVQANRGPSVRFVKQ